MKKITPINLSQKLVKELPSKSSGKTVFDAASQSVRIIMAQIQKTNSVLDILEKGEDKKNKTFYELKEIAFASER